MPGEPERTTVGSSELWNCVDGQGLPKWQQDFEQVGSNL